jgi:hypothetical protein
VFGPDDEDVCVYGASDSLPDEPNTDIIIHIRRGLPQSEIVDGLLAATIRSEEGLE